MLLCVLKTPIIPLSEAEKNFGLEWLEEANDFGMNNRGGEEIMEIEVDND